MPWKNGQGSTTELFRADGPDGDIGWRVSIAGVAVDGPFSVFPGYDRHIMIIKGDGMTLDGGPHGLIPVFPGFKPTQFLGDWLVSARLNNGPISDFNLIVRRAAFRSELAFTKLTSRLLAGADGSLRFLHVFSGNIFVNGKMMQENSSCMLAGDEELDATAAASHAAIAVCSLRSLASISPSSEE